MDFKNEDMLDLNEENVKQLFNFCIATEKTSKTDTTHCNFLENGIALNIPNIAFNIKHLRLKFPSIKYMICQLEKIHEHSGDMILTDGFKKYDGTNWTSNKGLLFSLYYLGCASAVLPFFKQSDIRKNIICPLYAKPSLKPTLSPNDPNFEEWSKKELAKTKKKSGGQEPADD